MYDKKRYLKAGDYKWYRQLFVFLQQVDYDEPLRQRLFSLEVSASDGKAQDKVRKYQVMQNQVMFWLYFARNVSTFPHILRNVDIVPTLPPSQ